MFREDSFRTDFRRKGGGDVTCLAIGDPHFKTRNGKDTDELTSALISLVKTRTPDFLVVLGDVLDRHETIHVTPWMRATRFLESLASFAPLYVLVGNHDRPNNSVFLTEEHPFHALKCWDRTVIVDRVLQEEICGHRFMWVPYVPPGRFREALDTVPPWEMSTAIFAHQEFREAQMGAIRSAGGDAWDLSFPLVVSGHIHDYDRLQPNILYVGTPMAHAFGDREDKTVSWLTWHADGSWTEERIDLGLPPKKIVYLTFQDLETVKLPEKAQIKIVFRGNSSEIKIASRLSQIKEWIRQGIPVVYKEISARTESSTLPFEKPPTFEIWMAETLKKSAEYDILGPLWEEIQRECI